MRARPRTRRSRIRASTSSSSRSRSPSAARPASIHDVRLRIRGICRADDDCGRRDAAARPSVLQGRRHGARARLVRLAHRGLESKQTYWLNHYPKVGHTIYNEDFEATIPVAGGAAVVVRVVDGNDRQIDNSEAGRPDRMQIIKGVVDKPLAGQMLRLDVVAVTAQ